MTELPHDLVAHDRFKWRKRMSLVPRGAWPEGYTRIDAVIVAVDPRPGKGPWGVHGYLDMDAWLPDLECPATAGILVAMLPRGPVIKRTVTGWQVSRYAWPAFESEHLGVAVARALLAAWNNQPKDKADA